MATFVKRGDAWRAQVRRRGVVDSATFPTKGEARAWAEERESEILAGFTGKAPRKTLRDALDRYADEVSPTHRGERWERVRLAKMAREMACAGTQLGALQPAAIAEWRDARLAVVAPASAARELQLLRAVLEVARREWGWLKSNPAKDVKKPISPPPRRRRIENDELERLCAALGYVGRVECHNVSQRVAVALLLAVETAMRCGELCALTWSKVRLRERFVELERTKNGDAREVPLSKRAVELLESVGKVDGDDLVLRLSTAQVDALFRKAKVKAGVHGLHFHDSRAEALTRLAKKVDVLTLGRIAGHRDLKSLTIYYRESASQIADRL